MARNENSYASLTELKGILGITSTTDDTVMRKILESASRSIETYCNRRFYSTSETKYFDGAVTLWIPDLLSINASGLKTDEDGDGTYENTYATTDYILYGGGLEDTLNLYPKTRIEINLNGDYGSFGYGVKNSVQIAGVWGYGDGTSATPYVADTTTAEALDASETGVDVTSAANLSAGMTILADSEQMYITSVSSNTLTVERGVNGTTAATHDTAKQLYYYRYPRDIMQACLDLSIALYQNRAKQGLQSERLGDYCLPTTAECLTHKGWTSNEQLTIGDDVLGYDSNSDTLKWTPVLDVHKTTYDGKMLHLKGRGFDTLASPNHRWYVKPLWLDSAWDMRIRKSTELNTRDRIPLSAPFIEVDGRIVPKWTDEFVECVGWFVTEGNYQPDRHGKRYAAFINQSNIVNGDNCNRINTVLTKLLKTTPPIHNHGNGNNAYYIGASTELYKLLCLVCPNKQLTMEFVDNLTPNQMQLLWTVLHLGDGDKTRDRFYQKNNETMATAQALSVLCGHGTYLQKKDKRKEDKDAVYSLSSLNKINRGVRELDREWIDYSGDIWCPNTGLGTWLTRDNGSTFITGNSYTIAGTSLGKSMVESILGNIHSYKRMRF